jgi:hypothetical protein
MLLMKTQQQKCEVLMIAKSRSSAIFNATHMKSWKCSMKPLMKNGRICFVTNSGAELEFNKADEDRIKVSKRTIGASVAAQVLVSLMTGQRVRSAFASNEEESVYDFVVKQYGEDVSLSKYRGKVTVVVNVASE